MLSSIPAEQGCLRCEGSLIAHHPHFSVRLFKVQMIILILHNWRNRTTESRLLIVTSLSGFSAQLPQHLMTERCILFCTRWKLTQWKPHVFSMPCSVESSTRMLCSRYTMKVQRIYEGICDGKLSLKFWRCLSCRNIFNQDSGSQLPNTYTPYITNSEIRPSGNGQFVKNQLCNLPKMTIYLELSEPRIVDVLLYRTENCKNYWWHFRHWNSACQLVFIFA